MKYGILTLLILLACSGKNYDQMESTSPTSIDSESHKMDSSIMASFNINASKQQVITNDEDLFGKFYNDRIEFHIVDRPSVKILDTPVKKMTLYFIDSVLCKKRFELEQNISNELMKNLGSFKFKPFGTESLNAAKNNGIIIYQANGPMLNPHLSRFQMKWIKNDRTIVFRHEQDSLTESNIYEEQLPEYKRLFNSVQGSLN